MRVRELSVLSSFRRELLRLWIPFPSLRDAGDDTLRMTPAHGSEVSVSSPAASTAGREGDPYKR